MDKKIKYQDIEKIYFIGIGGIGMSALARYFNAQGKEVKGYDKTPSPLTQKLQDEGIAICFEDDVALLDKQTDFVVYTPAIPQEHKQYNWYLNNGFEVRKRSYVLGLLTQEKFCVAVAGSHGKTTVSSMIAHILNETIGCTAFLGGIVTNFQSNYINSNSDIVVVEADEYDRSFMTLKPNISIITSVDTDHLDIYENYENIVKEFKAFAQLLNVEDTLIAQQDVSKLNLNTSVLNRSYGLQAGNIKIENYTIQEGKYVFDVQYFDEQLKNLKLHLPGKYNMENALAAIAVAKALEIPNEAIRKALASFQGIYRRFEKRAETEKVVYIDDYAHHPNEVKALLHSVNEMYPERNVVAVFQPHLFTRTRDLAVDFAAQLSLADEVVLLPIYPAREKAIQGVSSALISDKIEDAKNEIVSKENLLAVLKTKLSASNKKNVLLSIGAGDIDRFINPIADLVNNL